MSTLSPEAIQKAIDAAEKDSYYYVVSDPSWKKKAVIGGAARRWATGEDFVLAPGGRLCGKKEEVLAKLKEYGIDDHSLYESKESEGYKEELEEYRSRHTHSVADEDIEELKKSIKSTSDKPSLSSLIKGLASGRAVDVTDIAEGKLRVVNAPIATAGSRYVAVPTISIISKTKESYEQALNELGIADEKKALLLAAFDALYKLRKTENVQTVKVQEKPAKKTNAKKVAPPAPVIEEEKKIVEDTPANGRSKPVTKGVAKKSAKK